MDYASFADYWEPLLGGQGPFGSYVAGLPERRRARIRAAVRAAYCAGARPTARARPPPPPGRCAGHRAVAESAGVSPRRTAY